MQIIPWRYDSDFPPGDEEMKAWSYNSDYFSSTESSVSKGLNHSIAILATLMWKYLVWELRCSFGDIICNSEDFYIRAWIRRRPVSDSRASVSAFCRAHVVASGTNGMFTGHVAKGTSYSRDEKCRRRNRFSCPLGKSDTKSIHVYLRTCGIAPRSAKRVARKADGTLPAYLQLFGLPSVWPRFWLVYDMTSINFILNKNKTHSFYINLCNSNWSGWKNYPCLNLNWHIS